MSDVANASHCECVMLNKGPNLIETVRFLADQLAQHRRRNHKHRLMLRTLSSVDTERVWQKK